MPRVGILLAMPETVGRDVWEEAEEGDHPEKGMDKMNIAVVVNYWIAYALCRITVPQ